MKLIYPPTEEKRRQLEEELEAQKKRFKNAVEQSSIAIKNDLSPLRLIREHPLETLAVLVSTGFLAFQLFYPKARPRLQSTFSKRH